MISLYKNILKELIKETTGNLREAESSILRFTNDQYRKIIYDAQVYANTGSGTLEQSIDMATQDFLSKGINNIEYANGRMVNIASYVEMAIRTANTRATLYGEGLKRDEWGIHTVLVPNRGGGCPKCVKFQGRIYIDDVYSNGTTAESDETGYPLLSTIVKQGFLHPNCKDTFVTYFPGVNTEPKRPTAEEIERKRQNYINKQKLNYIDRNIDKYSRLELGSIDTENAEKYHTKRLQWQEYKERFKQNHSTKFSDIEKEDSLSIPNLVDKTLKQQKQTLNKNAEDFINKNLTENDVIQDKLKNAPFAYSKTLDKIVIDLNHEDIDYYNVDESIVHEIIHMKDYRENITNNNFEKLNKLVKSSKLYIDNNYSYFYNYLQRDRNNMALCDIMSALSNGKLSGDFGHFPEYWTSETIVLNELSANLISSKIVGNNNVEKLLDEIPPLKELMEECVKLWRV